MRSGGRCGGGGRRAGQSGEASSGGRQRSEGVRNAADTRNRRKGMNRVESTAGQVAAANVESGARPVSTRHSPRYSPMSASVFLIRCSNLSRSAPSSPAATFSRQGPARHPPAPQPANLDPFPGPPGREQRHISRLLRANNSTRNRKRPSGWPAAPCTHPARRNASSMSLNKKWRVKKRPGGRRWAGLGWNKVWSVYVTLKPLIPFPRAAGDLRESASPLLTRMWQKVSKLTGKRRWNAVIRVDGG